MNLSFLSGKKTYLVGAVMVAGGLVAIVVPGSPFVAQYHLSPELVIEGLAILALRAGIKKAEAPPA